jgi:hypothetical protein
VECDDAVVTLLVMGEASVKSKRGYYPAYFGALLTSKAMFFGP